MRRSGNTGRRRLMTARPMPSFAKCPGRGVHRKVRGCERTRGRLGRDLVRAAGFGRQGIELGADRCEWAIRGSVPLLRTGKIGIRQNVGAAGHRTDCGPVSEEKDAMTPNRRETISLLASA